MTPRSHPPRKPTEFSPIVSIYNHVTVAAPPIAVLQACIDTTTWPIWNTYMPTATVYYKPLTPPASSLPATPELAALFARPNHLSPGCKFTTTHSDGSPPSNIEVDDIFQLPTRDLEGNVVNGYRAVGWVIDVMPWLMKVFRVQEFTELEGGKGTKYESWTDIGGASAWLVKLVGIDKKIERLFDESFVSMKDYIETGKGKEGGKREITK